MTDAELILKCMGAFEEVPYGQLTQRRVCRWVHTPVEEFGEGGRVEWLRCQASRHDGQGIVGGWVSMVADLSAFTFTVWGTCDDCHDAMVVAADDDDAA